MLKKTRFKFLLHFKFHKTQKRLRFKPDLRCRMHNYKWKVKGKGGYILTRRVLERVHFWARPTIEKGSQCVGMKEWRSETVAIPPIVDRSSALNFLSITLQHSINLSSQSITVSQNTKFRSIVQRSSIANGATRTVSNLQQFLRRKENFADWIVQRL